MNQSIIDGGELDINELTLKIFTEPVKPPKSNQLSFDDITLKELFEVLLTFMVEGMKLKFSTDGTTVNIEELTDSNVQELIGYIQSIGFNLKISKYTLDEYSQNIFPYFVQFNNMEYDKNETDLTKYQFLIQKQLCYIISFDFIR